MTATSPARAKRKTLAAAAQAATALRTHPPLTLPLSKLFLSLENVRKQAPSREGIEELAALIDAEGLLAPLLVTAEVKDGKPTGRYGVEAGGRRWRALRLLVEKGRLDAEVDVPCGLIEAASALGVGLAENISQEPMHAADEFAAFAALVEQGHSVRDIAARFGVTTVRVEQRMRLGRVASPLLALFREGKATLDQMMALATVDDHKAQLGAWKSFPDFQRSPGALRRKLHGEEVSIDDPRLKLVTMKRYRASGGEVRTDLFTEQTSLTDSGLLDLLVAEVLAEAEAQVQAEGWGFVEVFMNYSYAEREQFRKPPARLLPESDDARAHRETLQAELEALEDAGSELSDADEPDEEKLAANGRRQEEVRAQLAALHAALVDPAGYPRAELGAVIYVDQGRVQIDRGLMTAKAAAAAARGAATPDQAADLTARPEISDALTNDLTSHRTAALQAAAVGNQPVALAALATRMSQAVFEHGSHSSMPLIIDVKQSQDRIRSQAVDFAVSRAAGVIDAEHARLQALLPENSDEWLTWFLQQPLQISLDFIVFCAARSIDVIESRRRGRVPGAALADALQLDMADYWDATVDSYLGRVPKAKVIEAVTEACGTEAAKDLPKLKKAEAQAQAAQLLQGKRWLPNVLRRI